LAKGGFTVEKLAEVLKGPAPGHAGGSLLPLLEIAIATVS
jgi:hypothetical protein